MVAEKTPLVGVLMGSKSDWEVMERCGKLLAEFGVPHESKVMSAHRTPALVAEYASQAATRGIEVLIAGAGLAAALPGVVAAHTTLPVLGVPLESGALRGTDALYAIVQMPPGIPVGTLGIGKPGATNAALLAIAILAGKHPEYGGKLAVYRAEQAQKICDITLPGEA